MRKMAIAAALSAMLVGSVGQVDAATITVVLNPDGNKEIDIPITQDPTEFEALLSSWGRLTFNGSLVGFYVFSREDKIHSGSQAPTDYPNPQSTIAIRALGVPTQVLILTGVARPLAEGGGAMGGVTVATGPLAFLRGATFTLVSGVLTFTF